VIFQAHLEAVAAGNAESVPEKDRGEYKKRKLVQVLHNRWRDLLHIVPLTSACSTCQKEKV
jgi:hypothetical protein